MAPTEQVDIDGLVSSEFGEHPREVVSQLPGRCLEYGQDLKKRQLLQYIMAGIEPQYPSNNGTDRNTEINAYTHHLLSLSYLNLGLPVESIRHGVLAIAGATLQGDEDRAKYAKATLGTMGFSEGALAEVQENPTKAVRDALTHFKDNFDVPKLILVDNDGEPIDDPVMYHNINQCLQIQRVMEPFERMGVDFDPQEPTQEQQHWINLTVLETPKILKAMGINTQKIPDPNNIIIVPEDQFDQCVGGDRNSPVEVQKTIRDENITEGLSTASGNVYIEAGQPLWKFIHTISHELFGHSCEAITLKMIQVGSSSADVNMLIEKSGLCKTEYDAEKRVIITKFEFIHELFTELAGYIFRLHLYNKYREELERMLGKEKVDTLMEWMMTNNMTKAAFTIVDKIAKKLNVSQLEALLTVLRSRYTEDDTFHKLMGEIYSPEDFQLIANWDMNDMNSVLASERLFGIDIYDRDVVEKARQGVFTAGYDMKEEPLIQEVQEFLAKLS